MVQPADDMSEIAKQVGETIRMARKEKGFTQQGLAEKLGINRATVARYEAGGQNLTVETIQKIATALGAKIIIPFNP